MLYFLARILYKEILPMTIVFKMFHTLYNLSKGIFILIWNARPRRPSPRSGIKGTERNDGEKEERKNNWSQYISQDC